MLPRQVEIILAQVQRLSPEDRLELLNRLTEWLDRSKESAEGLSPIHGVFNKDISEATRLVYGKYRATGRPESTHEHFLLAEWRQN